jgi:putative ABC transport system permease protein
MTEAFFSINDLLRRKLQTSLVIIGVALCAGSTLFLLLLSDKIGFGILSVAESRLTTGFIAIFSRFIIFVGFLVFLVGAVIISFLVHAMMAQRTRDIGLMKAAGCPNDLVFGYFMNELIIVTIVGCLLGVAIGLIADYVTSSVFTIIGFQVASGRVNPWIVLITFAAFVGLSLVVGIKPVLAATRVRPATALSPSFSFGLSRESDFKGVSRAGLTVKMAVRSLFRRKSTNSGIILCLTVVFILVTVSVAGGIIANETTRSWVERAVGKNVILIAHQEMTDQYELLLSKFYTEGIGTQFNYSDKRYLVSEDMLSQLGLIHGLAIDPRLILETQVKENQGIVLGQNTGETTYVGDNRRGTSLIAGVEPDKVLGQWFVDGNFLNKEESASDAVIGDTLGLKLFSQPLAQNVTLFNRGFRIVGVCLDPINNGNVTYVPFTVLQSATGISGPNIIMVRIDATTNRKEVLDNINTTVRTIDSKFEVSELDEILNEQIGFLGYIWSTIMLLPMLSLSAAALCLMGYVVLTINEQRQEFGILRAVGAKPRTVVGIVMTQNLLVLLSSWAAGIALGMIATLMILIPEPLVTGSTIAEIAVWLLLALAAIFASSLYPALRFARKPILEIMTHH